MITRDIDKFVTRDWQAARDSKTLYWGERIARLGPLEGLRVVDELRRQALMQNPGWPSVAARSEDLAFHAKMVRLFRRAAAARRP